jgi:hypothetical protein
MRLRGALIYFISYGDRGLLSLFRHCSEGMEKGNEGYFLEKHRNFGSNSGEPNMGAESSGL